MDKGNPEALGTFAALEANVRDAEAFTASIRENCGDDNLALAMADRLEAQAVALLYFAKRYIAQLLPKG